MKLPDFLTQDRYGQIDVTGHRIGLFTLVRDYKEGWTVERIAEEYPSLPFDVVRGVIDFYLANRAEVDEYVASYQAELDRQAAQPPGPGVIKIRKILEAVRQADARHAAEPEWLGLSVMEKVRRLQDQGLVETT